MFTTNELNEWSNQYQDSIKNEKLKISKELRTDFVDLLKIKDLNGSDSRDNAWKTLRSKYKPKELKKLANPYFIGYGNPSPNTDAKILFLGKEKAFDAKKESTLFLWESINNILLVKLQL